MKRNRKSWSSRYKRFFLNESTAWIAALMSVLIMPVIYYFGTSCTVIWAADGIIPGIAKQTGSPSISSAFPGHFPTIGSCFGNDTPVHECQLTVMKLHAEAGSVYPEAEWTHPDSGRSALHPENDEEAEWLAKQNFKNSAEDAYTG